MPRKNQPAAPPAPGPEAQERAEDRQIEQGESSFIDEQLRELPPLIHERPPGHEETPTGDEPPPEGDELKPPTPSSKTPAAAPKPAPVKAPERTPGEVAKPPDETPTAEDGKTKAKEGFVDNKLEEELGKIVPKGKAQEEGFPPLKEHIRKLNTRIKTEFEPQLAEAQKKIKELEGKALPEDRLKDFEALQDYIRHTSIENDPEFKRTYDKKVQGVESDAIDFLTKVGMDAKVADLIKSKGGVLKFSQSQEVVKVGDVDMTLQQYFDKYIFGGLQESSKHQLGAIMAKGHSVERERQEAIDQAKANAPEYLTKKQQEAMNRFNTEAGGRMKELIGEMPEDLPREIVEIPEDASPEEKARLEEQNSDFKEADAYISKMAYASTGKDKAEVAFYAALGKFLLKNRGKDKEAITALTKRAEEAEAELEGIRNAQSMGRRRGAPPVPAKKDQRTDTELTDQEAIDKYLP